jgi:ribose transport system ATP-binding protein
MGIASGQIDPDEGEILFEGLLQPQLTPTDANELGIAMVHQHPALLPDLTVEENLRLGIPSEHLQFAGSTEASMRALLDEVGMTVHLHDRSTRYRLPTNIFSRSPRHWRLLRSC